MRKLDILIYIYLLIYFLFSVSTIVTDIKDKEPWWDVVSGLTLLPLGGVGMLLYLFSVDAPSLKLTWKVVSIVIVAGLFFTNVASRYLTLAGKRELDSKKLSQWAILGADLVTVLLLAPMFVMNLLFAFRSSG